MPAQFAVSEGDGSVKQEVERRCEEHAPFLYSHFHSEEMFSWQSTSFYPWIFSLKVSHHGGASVGTRPNAVSQSRGGTTRRTPATKPPTPTRTNPAVRRP